MNDDSFSEYLIETAEKIDRKLSPERIRALKDSYIYFLEAGMSEEDIKQIMGLTAHHVRLIAGSKAT